MKVFAYSSVILYVGDEFGDGGISSPQPKHTRQEESQQIFPSANTAFDKGFHFDGFPSRCVLVRAHWAIAFVVACCVVALTSGMRTLLGCDILVIIGKRDPKLPAGNIPLI